MARTQWYETEDGMRRLAIELEAVRLFNAPRGPAFKLAGKKHRLGHLIFQFAFKPLRTRPDVVSGELILSSRHPQLEPVARIDAPVLVEGQHLTSGEFLRDMVLERTIPLDWSREAERRCPCMFDHMGGGKNAWRPELTVVSAILNVQSWFVNYIVFRNTGRWPYDEVAA